MIEGGNEYSGKHDANTTNPDMNEHTGYTEFTAKVEPHLEGIFERGNTGSCCATGTCS